MASGFNNNPIINRTGSIPGAIQGPIANRPPAGYVTGDWYLALDTQILYEWDGSHWQPVLSYGGGGGTPDWQAVMAMGNSSNIFAVLQDSGNNNIAAIGDIFGFGGGAFAITNPAGYPLSGTSQAIYGYVLPGATFPEDCLLLEWYDGVSGDASSTSLQHRINTTRRRIYLPDNSGDAALGKSGQFSQALTAGQTLIPIPHGMWPAPIGATAPTNASINATDSPTATVLHGGYYLTYDTTYIRINLTVPVVGTPTANISWSAFI